MQHYHIGSVCLPLSDIGTGKASTDYNDVNYDEVMKMQNMKLWAPDEGVFNFKVLCH